MFRKEEEAFACCWSRETRGAWGVWLGLARSGYRKEMLGREPKLFSLDSFFPYRQVGALVFLRREGACAVRGVWTECSASPAPPFLGCPCAAPRFSRPASLSDFFLFPLLFLTFIQTLLFRRSFPSSAFFASCHFVVPSFRFHDPLPRLLHRALAQELPSASPNIEFGVHSPISLSQPL